MATHLSALPRPAGGPDGLLPNCYQLPQKRPRNETKQHRFRAVKLLKDMEEDESRENCRRTHNPKVGGSNPPPATKAPQADIPSVVLNVLGMFPGTRLISAPAPSTPLEGVESGLVCARCGKLRCQSQR